MSQEIPKKSAQEGERQEKEGKESEALRSNENLPTKVLRFLAFVSWKASPHLGEGDFLRAVDHAADHVRRPFAGADGFTGCVFAPGLRSLDGPKKNLSAA